jgi:AraC family transcriptional regulator
MNDFTAASVLQGRDPGAVEDRLAAADIDVELASIDGPVDGVHVPASNAPALLWIADGAAVVERRAPAGTWQATGLRSGDFCLASGTAPIRLRPDEGSTTPLVTMRVLPGLSLLARVVRDIAGKPLSGFAFRDAAGEADDTLRALLEILFSLVSGHDRPCRYLMQGVGQALAAHLVRRYARSGYAAAGAHQGLPPYKLRRVMRAMRESLAEPFDLERLARHAGLSPFHFSRSFKKATGVAPSACLTRLRIDEARRRLAESDDAIIQVALAVGYRSPSHFSQVFRELTGISPTAFRQACTDGRAPPAWHGQPAVSPAAGAMR